MDVRKRESRAGRLKRSEPSPGRKSSAWLHGAGEGRFQRSPHPGSHAQAGRCEWHNNGVGRACWGHSGCGQSGAYTGLWGRKEMSAERWWARSAPLSSSASASGRLLPRVSMVLSVHCALTFRKSRKCPRGRPDDHLDYTSLASKTTEWPSPWDQRHRGHWCCQSSWMWSIEL